MWKITDCRGTQEVFYGNAYHPGPAIEFFGNIRIKF
jgi:hypothetical protein